MAESTQHKLDRVRKPRVQITYDVNIDDATETRELPFVVGVMGDFSGNPTEPLKPLKQRNFIAIDRDNFDEVMSKMTPGLNLKVENTLQGDGTELSVSLKFNSMSDFEPANVAKQVDPLRKLLETREKLKSLQAMAAKSDKLEEALDSILKETDKNRKKEDKK